jgi:uncharacterized protein YqkB
VEIKISEAALDAFRQQLPDANAYIKLVYDSEGCGCAVSGIAQLWLVDTIKETDLQARCEGCPIFYEKRHEIFFDEHMRIDYNKKNGVFTLISNYQIYHNAMTLIDKRNG